VYQPPVYQGRQPIYSETGQAVNEHPQYAPPVYLPPAQPYPQPVVYVQQRRSGWLSISCSVLVIILLMTCGLVGVVIYRDITSAVGQASKTIPARFTLVFFCGAEVSQQYSTAYQQFSTDLQQQVAADKFTQDSQQLDQTNGTVTACARSSSSSDIVSGSTVTMQVDVTRTPTVGQNNVSHGSIVLVQEGNNWRIDQIDASLGLM